MKIYYSILKILAESSSILGVAARAIPDIQRIYDEWDQDDSGFDDEYGTGGICDAIADAISSQFSFAGFDVAEGGQEGDDHAFVYVSKDGRAWGVDVSPGVYEIGSGYSWKKIAGVEFSASDFDIWEVKHEDLFQ